MSAELGGGKFASGALTGAFSRLYNEEAHHRNEWKKEREFIEASCENPSDCIRKVTTYVGPNKRYENIPLNSVPSKSIIPNPLEVVTDIISQTGFALEYIDTVKTYYFERKYIDHTYYTNGEDYLTSGGTKYIWKDDPYTQTSTDVINRDYFPTIINRDKVPHDYEIK